MIRTFAPNFGAGRIFVAAAEWPQTAVNAVENQRVYIQQLKAELNKYRLAEGKPAV